MAASLHRRMSLHIRFVFIIVGVIVEMSLASTSSTSPTTATTNHTTATTTSLRASTASPTTLTSDQTTASPSTSTRLPTTATTNYTTATTSPRASTASPTTLTSDQTTTTLSSQSTSTKSSTTTTSNYITPTTSPSTATTSPETAIINQTTPIKSLSASTISSTTAATSQTTPTASPLTSTTSSTTATSSQTTATASQWTSTTSTTLTTFPTSPTTSLWTSKTSPITVTTNQSTPPSTTTTPTTTTTSLTKATTTQTVATSFAPTSTASISTAFISQTNSTTSQSASRASTTPFSTTQTTANTISWTSTTSPTAPSSDQNTASDFSSSSTTLPSPVFTSRTTPNIIPWTSTTALNSSFYQTTETTLPSLASSDQTTSKTTELSSTSFSYQTTATTIPSTSTISSTSATTNQTSATTSTSSMSVSTTSPTTVTTDPTTPTTTPSTSTPSTTTITSEPTSSTDQTSTTISLPTPTTPTTSCGIPPVIDNGLLFLWNTTINATANYTCNPGYHLEGDNEILCQENGTWTDAPPECLINDCGPLSDIANGEVIFLNTTVNATANYTCYLGFYLVGVNETMCQDNGTWMDLPPKCFLNDCGPPPNITYGSFRQVFGNTTYTSVITYSCDPGYMFNGTVKVSQCLANGIWAGLNGRCVPIVCEVLVGPPNGKVEYGNTTLTTFSCIGGFILVGWKTVTCLSSGEWNAPVPKCQKTEVQVSDCEDDTDNIGTTWEKTKPGQTVSKSCPQGLEGIVSRNCTPNGSWKLPKYSCVKEEIAEAEQVIDAIDGANVTDEVKRDTVTNVLDSLSTSTNTSSSDSALFDGAIEKVTSILDKVATISKDIVVSEEQSENFLATTSNLLNPQNSDSYKSLDENSDSQEGSQSTGAGKVLEVVGNFVQAIANSLNATTDGSRTIKQDNLLVTVAQHDETDDIHFPETVDMSLNTSTSVTITKSFLEGVASYSGILYPNLTGLLPPRLDDNGIKDEHTYEINAPVMDMQLLDNTSGRYIPPYFKITLHFDNFKKGHYDSRCAYWNFTKNSWDTYGCSLDTKNTNSSYSVCICNHTTNFAILMNPSITPNLKTKALDYISIIGCSVSFVCLIVTIVMHAFLWRYLKSDRAKILINLSMALILSYAIFLAGVDHTENQAVCTGVAVALHYIYLVVFVLMLSEGIEILITVRFVFLMKSRLRWLLVISWGLPAVVVGISVGITRTEGYGSEDFCWLSVNSGLIWAFVGPALTVIVANFILIMIVMKTMFSARTLKERSRTEKVKTGVRCLCILLPLTGGTWVIGVFYVNESLAWIQYVFAVLNSLQGLFIMFFHCVINAQMRHAISRRRKKYQASSSFTKSSGKTLSNPRPTGTSGVYKDLYDSLSDSYADTIEEHRYYDSRMLKRQGSGRHRWRNSTSIL